MGKKRQNEEKTDQNEYDLSSKHLKTSHVRANDKRYAVLQTFFYILF